MVSLISFPLYGQLSIENDTVKIKEVVIRGKRVNPDPSGYKITTFDSSRLVNYNNRNLSDILSENTGIFIKSYGMGGTATPSFRGTAANNTLIDWNGININSPMLGQSDFALIPVGMIDNIQIYYGGASMPLNNGGIGGTINLETKPDWKKETLISVNSSAGSFGQYSGLVKIKTGNYRFQTITKGYFQNEENNFRYLNSVEGTEPVWQTRTNNQVKQHGFVQEVYFQNHNSVTSARVWYENSARNLPASLLTAPNSGEKQFDESFRTMLNYDSKKGSTDYSVTGAWMLTNLNYLNPQASIDSRNLSEILTFKASLEKPLSENSKFNIAFDEQSSLIKSNNYDGRKTRNTASLTISVDRKSERFGTKILLREILDKSTFLFPDFSAGMQFRLLNGREYYIKANISRNSRIPSMNDLFWLPGGNPDLKNEYAFIYEASFEMDQRISDPLHLKYDLSVFRNNIKDMILWHQGEYSYWTPDNISAAVSAGAESTVSLDYILNHMNATLKACYTYTRATSAGSGREQLMYIPENQANASFRFGYGKIYASWLACFTGVRYIMADNSNYLPGYLTNNFTTGIKVPVKASFIDLNINIDNIFNVDYQSIAYYPLPGRSYSLKILVQIIK